MNAPFEVRLKLADLIFQNREKATKEIYDELKECMWP
jgi:hypothetical protein